MWRVKKLTYYNSHYNLKTKSLTIFLRLNNIYQIEFIVTLLIIMINIQ